MVIQKVLANLFRKWYQKISDGIEFWFIGITNIPRTCIEEFDLLSRETLDQRVAFISAIEGLEQPATADSVDFMSIALEVKITILFCDLKSD